MKQVKPALEFQAFPGGHIVKVQNGQKLASFSLMKNIAKGLVIIFA